MARRHGDLRLRVTRAGEGFVERVGDVPGAIVDVVDGVQHELHGRALADDEVVAVVGLAEQRATAFLDDQHCHRRADAEQDGEYGEPRAEGTLPHLLEDQLEEVHVLLIDDWRSESLTIERCAFQSSMIQ